VVTHSRRDFFKGGLGLGLGSAVLPAACSAPPPVADPTEDTAQVSLMDLAFDLDQFVCVATVLALEEL
jgi:hypothetical protein